MNEAINYVDAWRLWTEGNENLRGMDLWGMPVFWWGRIGKVLAFLAGFTLLLDILGPERIREYSKEVAMRLARKGGKHLTNETIGLGGTFVGAILAIEVVVPDGGTPIWVYLVVVPLCGGTVMVLSILLRSLVIVILNRNKAAHVLRWICLSCFLIGFHFDMLAS